MYISQGTHFTIRSGFADNAMTYHQRMYVLRDTVSTAVTLDDRVRKRHELVGKERVCTQRSSFAMVATYCLTTEMRGKTRGKVHAPGGVFQRTIVP